ncbi:MAG: NUDIX domain-containing protein [Kribbellaceae bacterium]
MPAGPLIVAAAAVVRAGELLVVSKRAAPEVFYLPGGKPEPGESLPDAVQREVHEELGVGVATMRPFAVVEDVAAPD